jgi:hypothetical protein
MAHLVENAGCEFESDGTCPIRRVRSARWCVALAIVGEFVLSGWAQAPAAGIRPLDPDTRLTAIRDGEQGRVPPSSPFSLRRGTIREGKAAEDPIGPMDETGLRGIEARAPFSFVVLSPYVRVALAAAEAKRTGQPGPDQRLEAANAQVVTCKCRLGRHLRRLTRSSASRSTRATPPGIR